MHLNTMLFVLLQLCSCSALLLGGRTLPRVSDGAIIDLGEALAAGPGLNLAVLGTYPADFNMIEYAQRLNHFLPQLKAKGVGRVMCVINGSPASCTKLADLLDLSPDIELCARPSPSGAVTIPRSPWEHTVLLTLCSPASIGYRTRRARPAANSVSVVVSCRTMTE